MLHSFGCDHRDDSADLKATSHKVAATAVPS
jgi:hypothetical protein